MKLVQTKNKWILVRRTSALLLLFSVLFSGFLVRGQTSPTDYASAAPKPLSVEGKFTDNGFRVEKMLVAGGSEVITIFVRQGTAAEIPLVSILRDTLGDALPENDRLRYVWMHTYTRPSLSQKVSAFIPFLYTRTTNRKNVGTDPPPAVIDVQMSDKAAWNMIFWTVFKKIVLGGSGVGVKSSSSQYMQNKADYHKAAVATALTVLSLYQESVGESVLTETELKDIQARLFLTEKTFGWHVSSDNLGRVFDKERALARDFRGHNWELLRQYSESQGLYFEPLEMQDGTARHAIVWTTASDLAANRGKAFERRFLNIKNPWTDKNLLDWKGYSQVRWLDAEERSVAPNTPGATPKTFIPLALYGLDNPKIPIILVDFRDNGNPKLREMSKRVLKDVTGNILSLSRFSSFPYFFGMFLYEFIPGRRGMDINQASRLRSYAQLKLLISLDESLEPDFRSNIANGAGHATLNPMENDSEIEAELSRKQYQNLIAYAKRDDGLPAKIDEDRREEMVRLKHGTKDRILFSLGHVFSFGLYTHREKRSPELLAQLDIRRQLDYHERYLRETAAVSANPEVDTNIADLKRSLRFVAEHGSAAAKKTSRALGTIFAISKDEDLQTLSLNGLYRINNSAAKKELLGIYKNPVVDERWRNYSAHYLKQAMLEGQRISRRDAQAIEGIAVNNAN